MPQTNAVPPSVEVREEARRRAIRIAEGLYPHQVEGVAFSHARQLKSALAKSGEAPAGYEPVAEGRSA